jgi:hypothetical protein
MRCCAARRRRFCRSWFREHHYQEYSGFDLSGDAEIIQALETEAAEARRRFRASLPPLDDSVPLIRVDRKR